MLTQIIQHAPTWVWALLAGLIALGLSQTFARSMTLTRATIVPVVMVCLSFYGVSSVFGPQPLALLAWAKGLAAAASLTLATRLWRGIAWSSSDQRLLVPGSWIPLVLILGLFLIKFAVGASLAMHPALRTDPIFAAVIGLAYGAFSGMFLGRGIAMWKLARQALRTPAQA